MKMFQSNTRLLLTLISGVTMTGMTGCWHDGNADTNADYQHAAQGYLVSLQDEFLVHREFAGEVQAFQTSALGFELPGQVSELMVNEGDMVISGQVLARLDTRLLQSERRQLEAQQAELSAERALVERNLERVTSLQERNLASAREADELSSRAEVLRASQSRIDAALQSNSIRLQQSELRAPFDAQITRRNIDTGAVVSAGNVVLVMTQNNHRELTAGLPARIAESLQPGDEVDVNLRDQLITGKIIAVGPEVEASTQTRLTRIAIDDASPPGTLAYVQIEEQQPEHGAWIPATAITEGVRGTWVVYAAIADQQGTYKIEPRTVVVRHTQNNRVFVTGALSNETKVIASGLHRYAPGQTIRLKEAEANLNPATTPNRTR